MLHSLKILEVEHMVDEGKLTGKALNNRFEVGAKHALYREDGKWYHMLKIFPGALFDVNGYVRFETETEFRKCGHLQIAQDVHVPQGISSIPGYTRFTAVDKEIQPLKNQLLETHPPVSRSRRRSSTRNFRPRKAIDYSEMDAKNRALGLAGEYLVLDHEKQLLMKVGRTDLAARVHHIAKVEGDGAGYDVKSFTPDEEVKYIEVKTTSGSADTSFHISSNELEFSKSHSQHYYLYRVYEYDRVDNCGKFYVKVGNLEDSFNLEPSQYRATL
jgi:Domain of unknown function (DUF3883)